MGIVEVEVSKSAIIINISKLRDRILALRTTLEIPMSKVINASTDRYEGYHRKLVKMAGSSFGSYNAGIFYHFGVGNVFLIFKNLNSCVIINTRDYRFKKVVIEVDNKYDVSMKINSALKS